MSDEQRPIPLSPEGSDVVIIGNDDISNYNPECILPEPEDTIASIREWLRPTEYSQESGEYHKHLTFHLEGTGEWLHHSENYRRWHESSKDGLLWIKGVPGSGKSVAAANIIHRLSKEQVPVLYFFFRQIIDANHRPVNLLRDWLDQILLFCPELQSVLKTYVDTSRSLDSVSIDELWRHLKVALSSITRVYCVADALDEMDEGNSEFITQLAELGHLRPSSVKVLLTSRPTANVEAAMRGVDFLNIRMEEALVDIDIATYVRHCLAITSISEGDQQIIKETVPGRANGLFLYAKLAMKAFLEPGASIQDTIRTLPLDLDAMYIDILREHARRSGISDKTQVMILQWVTHATRPLRLLELADMLGTAVAGRVSRTLKEDKDLVRAACGPLLEILPDETVSVVHHSLTEFLVGAARTGRPDGYPVLDPSGTHYDLAIVCLNYICSGWLRNQQPSLYSVEADRSRICLSFPFAAYAISNWNIHARKSEWKVLPEDKLSQQIDLFMRDSNTRNNWVKLFLDYAWDRWGEDSHVVSLSDLHLTALCGLGPTIDALVHRLGLKGQMLDVKDARGRTPLWWAASSGHADVVQLLLQHGASHKIADNSCLLPVHVAMLKDKFEVVRLFMENGTAPTLACPIGGGFSHPVDRSSLQKPTLLGTASKRGYLKTLEVMLPFCEPTDKRHALLIAIDANQPHIVKALTRELDYDVNEMLEEQTALFFAASRCRVEEMEILINSGADASIKCKPKTGAESKENVWSTALVEFCGIRRHYLTSPYDSRPFVTKSYPPNFKRILKLLIRAGADVNEKDSVGRSAIHSTECSDTFKYLLEAGADPAAQLKDGRTVLHCLPQDADEGYLKLLVESRNNGIDEREYRKGRTPLLSAIRSHSALAIPLLQCGSDCTIADFKGNGPLHYVFSYHNSQISPVPSRSICIDNTRDGSKIPKLVKALLEAGADPKLANCDGETPLHVLVAACYVDDRDLGYLQEAIELLLHHGADINAKDANGRTPFFRLAGRRFKSGQETTDFFKLFIEQSASLNTRDYEGRTLLHEAIYRISWEAKTRGMSTLSYEYLVDAGVSPSIPDFKGNTICHELILAPDCSRLKGMAKTFFPLFRNGGVETDKPNFSGTTPLQVACQMRVDDEHDGNRKAQDCLVWLLENSSDPDASDTRGLRAIHFAASTDTYTVDRLLRAGADPFATTHQGMNVLHIAARCKRSNSIGLLLERMNELSPEAKKTALNQKDVCQYTPLHYACRSGIIESVWLLIEAGADVNPTFDNSQETYLDEPWFPPILQCAFFRLENSLWRRKPTVPYPSSVGPGWRNAADHPDVPRGYNLIAGGYTVEDTSRHFDKTIPERQLSQLKIFDHAIDVSRYEGIVNALIAAGADVSQYGHGSTSYLYHAILFAADRLDDYATNLLGEMSKKIDHHAFPTPTHVSITLMKAHRQAEIAVLRDFFLPRAKETTWETVGRLLSERQFSLIKELNRAGADFTTRSARGVSIMHRLVEYGFYELVDDCYRPQEVSPPNNGEQISGNTTTDTKPLLMVACKRSTPNMEVIRVLVEKKGVDINAKDRSGLTALHYLATGRYWWQYSQAIPYLVSAGADLEAQNMDRQTPLLYSCVRKGTSWTAAVKTLIDLGADVKVVSRKGFSCLRYAAKDEALVRLLVSHGADVLPMDIIQAIKEHQAEVLRILLSVNEPLSLATSWKLKLEDAKEMDLDANPVQTDLIREGHPLFVASTTFMPVSDISTNDKRSVLGKMMKNLIATGFSPYDTCLSRIEKFRAPHRSSLPTGVAIQSWYKKESDSEMMFHSLNVFYSKPEGLADRVVMHQILSSGQGYYQPILELPDLDLEFRDGSGETLLLAACRRGPPRKAKEDRLPLRLLLERGADSFAVDYHGRNAMHHKLGSRALNDEKLEAIKDLGDAVPHLINQTDAYGFRPLHYGLAAVVHGETNQTEPDWVDYIISQGADMLIADALGNNALHYLASGVLGCLCYTGSNTKDLFEKFLALGLEINSRNNAGQTPAFFLATNVARKKATNAIEDHLDEVMSWLDSLGVDWHVKDELNRNILHEIAGESVKLFKAVMDQGVDPLAEDIDGRTSLDLAAAHGNGDVLKLFDREAKM